MLLKLYVVVSTALIGLFFYNYCSDINELTDTITEYILFCESICITTKTIKSFPNNKPWITKDIKGVINEKKIAFAEKNKSKLKLCQMKLDKEL